MSDFEMNFMREFRGLCRTIDKIEERLNPKDHLGNEPEEKPKEKCNCFKCLIFWYTNHGDEGIAEFCPVCGKKLNA